MSSSADLRRWARELRSWAPNNPYPNTVAQMCELAVEFESMADILDIPPAPQLKKRRRRSAAAKAASVAAHQARRMEKMSPLLLKGK